MERDENVLVGSVADHVVDANEFAAKEPVGESSTFQPVMDPSLVDPEMAEAARALVGMPQGGVAVAGVRQNVTTQEPIAEGFLTTDGAAGGFPAVVAGHVPAAVAGHGVETRADSQQTVFPRGDLPASAPARGAPPVDHSRTFGRELGPYELPRPLRQRSEQTPTPVRAGLALVTVSAQTNTTTTVTSTFATSVAVARPVYDPYAGYVPYSGPASVHPVNPAAMSQFIDSSGGLPGCLLYTSDAADE